MLRRPPRSTRTDTLFPYTTLFRSDRELVRRQHFEQIRLAGILADIHAAHGDGDDLRTAGDDRATRLVMVLVLAGTNQQTGVIGLAGNQQGIGFGSGPGVDLHESRAATTNRPETRRVGKECGRTFRTRWSPEP